MVMEKRTMVMERREVMTPVATYHRVVCPACGRVQGAAVVYHGLKRPWRGYLCLFCGEMVGEDRWQEVVEEDPHPACGHLLPGRE